MTFFLFRIETLFEGETLYYIFILIDEITVGIYWKIRAEMIKEKDIQNHHHHNATLVYSYLWKRNKKIYM